MRRKGKLLCAVLAVSLLITYAGAAIDRNEPLVGIYDMDGHWSSKQVGFIIGRELVDTITDTTFEPDTLATRVTLVIAFYRLMNEPRVFTPHNFEDVLKTASYSNAVSWSQYMSIVNGYNATTFGPDDPITREQLAALIYRYADYTRCDVSGRADLSEFTDMDTIGEWAVEAMEWCVDTGIITGRAGLKQGQIDPQGNATRAELCAVLQRFIAYAEF